MSSNYTKLQNGLQIKETTPITSISNDITLSEGSSASLSTSYALQTYIDNLTGTKSSYFDLDLDSTGIRLRNNNGVLELSNLGETDYVSLVVKNLTVQGTQTIVHSEDVQIDDNIITLNSNYTGSSPTEDGGIQIERGTLTNASLIWNETSDKWFAGLFGSEIELVNLSSSQNLSNKNFLTSVGIGTTNPVADLHVYDASAISNLRIQSEGAYNSELNLLNTNSDWTIYGHASTDSLRFYEGGVGDRITILSGGNVGIGTTNPAGKLHIIQGTTTYAIYSNESLNNPISGTARYYNRANVTYTNEESVSEDFIGNQIDIRTIINTSHTNSGYNMGQYINIFRNGYGDVTDDNGILTNLIGAKFQFGHYNTNTGATPITTNVYGLNLNPYFRTGTITNLYDIYIASGSTGGTVTNRWSIYQADTATRNYFGSNVGIGTTNPTTLLEVWNGEIRVTDSTNPQIQIKDPTGGQAQTQALQFLNSSNNARGQISYIVSTDTLSLFTAGTQKVTINSSGYVGIGTTNPTYNLEVNGNTKIKDYLYFDTTSTHTATVGQLTWNSDEGTLDLGLNGGQVINQIGQEIVIYAKASENINDGEVVYVSGAVGLSGKIEVSKFIADGTINPRLVVGIATESISIGDFGYITSFGKIRGIQTDGVNYSETWLEGQIIYASSTVSGGLTNVKPIAPNPIVAVAIVISKSFNQGTLGVRIPQTYNLGDLNNVYTPSLSANDVLFWDESNLRWENRQILISDILDLGPGTQNYLTKWIDVYSQGNSIIYDNGTNIGIGTTNPGSKLTLQTSNDTSDVVLIRKTTGSDRFLFSLSSGAANLTLRNDSSANSIIFNTNGNSYFNGGNLGIGTTNPGYKLEVNGTIKVPGATIDSSGTSWVEIDAITQGYLSIANSGKLSWDANGIYVIADKLGVGISSGLSGKLHIVQGTTINGIYSSESLVDPINGTTRYYNRTYLTYTGAESVLEDFIGNQTEIYSAMNTSHINTGSIYGNYINLLRNGYGAATDDSGTLTSIFASRIAYGHNNINTGATPITTNIYGIRLIPYARTGTITNLYDLYLDSLTSGGTITNRWSIYQADTATRNYFGSNVGIGTTSITSKLEVNGDIRLTTGSGSGIYFEDGTFMDTATISIASSAQTIIYLNNWQSDPDEFTVLKQDALNSDSKGLDLVYHYVFRTGQKSTMYTSFIVPFDDVDLQLNFMSRMSSGEAADVDWRLGYHIVSSGDIDNEIADNTDWINNHQDAEISFTQTRTNDEKYLTTSGSSLSIPSSAYVVGDLIKISLSRVTTNDTHDYDAEVVDSLYIRGN